MSQAIDAAQLHLFDLKGRQALVLGLGDSGVAMARWAARQGARVRVADTRSADGTDLPQLQALREQAGAIAIEYAGGPAWSERWLDGVDLVAWSPGLSIERGESARFHALARERGIAVAGELELFAQALADLRESGYRPKVIAVTGTNGKTTTVALAAHLCRGAGLETVAAGNIRPAMLDALGAAIDAGALPQAWVLELSSFQLALAQGFAPDAAAILNVSEDHLDWHATMDSYVAAKQRIYGPSTVAVFDRGDAATAPRRAAAAPAVRGADAAARRAEAQLPARRAGDARVDAGESRTGAPLPITITFGVDAPQAAGDFGLVRDGALVWLGQAIADDDAPAGRRRRGPAEFTVRRLMPVDALRIRGVHNQLNALGALALCSAIGVPMAKMLHALRDYAGEPHRCQLLAVIDGVEYYDDSKGTNVGATIAALRGLGRRYRLIAGGDGKGQDFAPLAGPVHEHAAAVYLIGRDAPLLRASLQATSVPLIDCASLEQAVERAAGDARPGEAVLLSPACASLDMFRSYVHRAEAFAQAVRGIAEARGVAMEARC